MAKGETYEQFIEKFQPKRTTDDCYTPQPVYEALLQWAASELHLEGRTIVRPFYPGGDYEHYDYPEGCVVIDNPPFSIYSRIVRFYLDRGIDFLLFAPGLTQMVPGTDVCYLTTMCDIIYENGAKVRTSFTTNLLPGVRLWTAPALREAVQQAADDYIRTVRSDLYKCKKNGAKAKYRWPDHLISSATVGKIAVRGVDLRISASECTYIRRAAGIDLFGSALLLTEQAAARRAAADRAAAQQAEADRVAAERVAAERAAALAKELIPTEIAPYAPKS